MNIISLEELMKIKKHKNQLYSVVNCGRGDIFYLNFRPNKQQLKDLCCREFCWEEENFNEGDVIVDRIDVYKHETD